MTLQFYFWKMSNALHNGDINKPFIFDCADILASRISKLELGLRTVIRPSRTRSQDERNLPAQGMEN
jgi:hypothetical protein